jgi:hypothetical protein
VIVGEAVKHEMFNPRLVYGIHQVFSKLVLRFKMLPEIGNAIYAVTAFHRFYKAG